MTKFKLKSNFKPIYEQKKAFEKLSKNILNSTNYQVLLGVTGSGKTFTVANVIEKLQKPALIISHNKTLAAQLYQEFRDFFPENAVNYFVSYYDYYQPEAYIPSTDTYIEKDADINDLIDKLRLSATTNLLTRNDNIVIASVSCIYNIGSPKEYGKFIFEITTGMKILRKQIIDRLTDLQYERSDFGFHRGTFRVTGDIIDVYPAYLDQGLRIIVGNNKIDNIFYIDPVSGSSFKNKLIENNFVLYPAKHFLTDPKQNQDIFKTIEFDLKDRIEYFKKNNKDVEAYRLKNKVTYDLEMIKEVGYVKGIENYSRYFDGRSPGEAPYTLLDYFNESYNKDWLVFIDESHITFPQIRGMYFGDLSRKNTLIDYGFRLPSALDNRPLVFDEFLRKIPNFIATSATPSVWEINMAKQSSKPNRENAIVQQLLRPTGIPDPKVEIRPVTTSGETNQVIDLVNEIKSLVKKKQRALVTTLTKQSAEDLSNFLKEKGVNVHYLHSDIKTLERTDILENLRKGDYDCIVGVNLLREGLDLPEVSLVAILDADKEGFLRSEVSLIQTMGRAARHIDGKVILYADKITGSMKKAIEEVKRRRKYQIKMNILYKIKPKSITKPIREKLIEYDDVSQLENIFKSQEKLFITLDDSFIDSLTPMDKKRLISKLKKEMKLNAQELNFEFAAEIRDKIIKLQGN